MSQYLDIYITDIKEINIDHNCKKILLDIFENILNNITWYTKKAEFSICDFANSTDYTKNYNLIMERITQAEAREELWQAIFTEKGKIKMIAMGQINR